MLGNYGRRAIGREFLQHRDQRFDPRGRTDGHDLAPRPIFADRNRLRRGCGFRPRRAVSSVLGARGSLHLVSQIAEGARIAWCRLADTVEGADFECRERGVRPAMGQRRDHDDRHGPQAHDLFEKLQPVHFRHLDVECHDIGIELLDGGTRFHGVAGLPDDFDLRIGLEHSRNQAAHGRTIIDDEYPCECAHAFLPEA